MAIHGLAFFWPILQSIYKYVGKLSKRVFIHSNGLMFFQNTKELVVRIKIMIIFN